MNDKQITYKELQEKAKELGLKYVGVKKDDLIKNIAANEKKSIDSENLNEEENNPVNKKEPVTAKPAPEKKSPSAEKHKKTLDINLAGVKDFAGLTGIGKATAQKIVDYRDKEGKFESVDGLTEVSGISEKTITKLKDEITAGQAAKKVKKKAAKEKVTEEEVEEILRKGKKVISDVGKGLEKGAVASFNGIKTGVLKIAEETSTVTDTVTGGLSRKLEKAKLNHRKKVTYRKIQNLYMEIGGEVCVVESKGEKTVDINKGRIIELINRVRQFEKDLEKLDEAIKE